MLKQLSINNFKLIDRLVLEFQPGLTVLTGETGAGKSIILSALTTLLGEKPGIDIFLDETRPVTIAAIFALPPNPELQQKLNDLGFADGRDEIILRRHLSLKKASGLNNRIYINDQPGTGATAAAIADHLLEFVDQHQQQTLRRPKELLRLLDTYGGLLPLKAEYSKSFHLYRQLEQEYKEWELAISDAARQMDYYRHQLQELEDAALKQGEEDELIERRHQYQQAGKLKELTREVDELTYSGGNSIIDNCYRLEEICAELARRDRNAPPTRESLTDVIDTLQEVYKRNSSYMNNLDIDEQTIDETEARLALLEKLKRKFATDSEGLLKLRDELKGKVVNFANRDSEKEKKQLQLVKMRQQMLKNAEQLSAARQKQGEALALAVNQHLNDLNLAQARFLISRETIEPGATGRDQISFLFSANPGEEPAAIDKNASGGELSRLLLALKTAIAHRYQVPTLIFDEVDTGLGGSTAAAVGRKIAAIARKCQVVTVTHLPQVAAFADQHLVIDKVVSPENNRTLIQLNEFANGQEDARIRELARMGSGKEVTAEAEEHARALRREAGKSGKGAKVNDSSSNGQ